MPIRTQLLYNLDGNNLDIVTRVCHCHYWQAMAHWGPIKGLYETAAFFLIGIKFTREWHEESKDYPWQDAIHLHMRDYFPKGYNIPTPPLPKKFHHYHYEEIYNKSWRHLDDH
jgi:hypothetical protein